MIDPLTDLAPRLDAKRLSLVFAAESGSRAWGFASPDSDFDIRFVFAKRTERYLSLHDDLQTIEYKSGELDFSGWDLRKTLLLAEKSNPSLIEWLRSPIVYADHCQFRNQLLGIVREHFSPKTLAHHYLSFMANIRGKYLSDFTGEYTCKRYFYALRPIFCILWMRDNPGQLPPVAFSALTSSMTLDAWLKKELKTLLVFKLEAKETDLYKSPQLDTFIQEWFEDGYQRVADFKERRMPIEMLDELFRTTLLFLESPLSD